MKQSVALARVLYCAVPAAPDCHCAAADLCCKMPYSRYVTLTSMVYVGMAKVRLDTRCTGVHALEAGPSWTCPGTHTACSSRTVVYRTRLPLSVRAELLHDVDLPRSRGGWPKCCVSAFEKSGVVKNILTLPFLCFDPWLRGAGFLQRSNAAVTMSGKDLLTMGNPELRK
jgi:hypothetical protein